MGIAFAETVWVIFAFLIGISVGSFLNVVVGRLPLEKSLAWPNSRCLTCLHALSLADNLPIIGWLLRRGRCQYCGTRFSSRYLWVELGTGIAFALLFYLEVLQNWHGLPFMEQARMEMRATGLPPWRAVVFFSHHAILLSFLISAALCDWDHKAIPLSLTVTGTLIGLISSVLWPWPFPNDVALVANLQNPIVQGGLVQPINWSFNVKPDQLIRGVYPWPVWGPLPDVLWNHRWLLGLCTGLTGAVVGMLLVRFVKFVFEKGLGKEALGLGDADLMMMAGAFLGWQSVFVAFFVGALVALPMGLAFKWFKGDQAFPFGPGLALGVVITWMWWPKLAPVLQMYLFEEILVLVAVGFLAAGLFVGSFVVRILGFGQKAEVK